MARKRKEPTPEERLVEAARLADHGRGLVAREARNLALTAERLAEDLRRIANDFLVEEVREGRWERIPDPEQREDMWLYSFVNALDNARAALRADHLVTAHISFRKWSRDLEAAKMVAGS